jgi:hypothetical protein
MPIHEFTIDYTPAAPYTHVPSLSASVGGGSGAEAAGPSRQPDGQQQWSHIHAPPVGVASSPKQGRVSVLGQSSGVAHEDIEDFLLPGFRALDEGMKMYWSGMRVPTKDAYRFLRIKVAGADKSVLIWRDELLNGRARLPVGALSRSKEEFNKDKFSPAYHPMRVRYASVRGNLAILTYRPTPWLVEYTLSVWAEHKRDAEYVKYQVLTRFNPLAEFRMSDGRVQGTLTIRFGGAQDQSDKEASFEQHRLIKYEYTMTAEAWLPLPERVLPTVLGPVVTVKDVADQLLYVQGPLGFR